jgi:hypothetical protein
MTTVWMLARTLDYLEGGGHFWVYLNWALGLRECGCHVVWLEMVGRERETQIRARLHELRHRLVRYGLGPATALCTGDGTAVPQESDLNLVPLSSARDADLLLNLSYHAPEALLSLFQCSAMVDMDPGLTQIWTSSSQFPLPPCDYYFTIGETVGTPGALFPDAGVRWVYTPPCVSLQFWPMHPAPENAPFTTVSHWYGKEWVGDLESGYDNSKRAGFLPYLSLPRRTRIKLELALSLGGDERERAELERLGWSIVDSRAIASTPEAYQTYIQGSRGEFSCVKPSCVRLQNAWISDRTLCYLASGRPAVIENTGPSALLPDDKGLLRFRNMDEALERLHSAEVDYAHHARAARSLAEEHFDARKVTAKLLRHIIGTSAAGAAPTSSRP